MLEPRYDSSGIISNRYQYDEPPVDYSDDDDNDENDSSSETTTNRFYQCFDDDDFSDSTQLTTTTSRQSQLITTINFTDLFFDKLIGQGGFGRVYRGKFHDITVAIKEPIYYNQNSINVINRSIVEEARLHFHLNHPNIIKMYGISINDYKIYLIMEYANGKSLRELLSKRPLSPNIIIKFAIQISSAMKYLHNLKPKPIIHRDLKSLNILLNEPINDGNWSTKEIKLTDLGLAREFTNSVSMMTQCGTYAWMAPESITDSKFSKASDVWSFGVVLWELLTGQIPYKNVSGPAVAFGIGNRKLTLPIPKTCPEELKRILQECWYQNPNLRPSFKKIRKDLEQSSFNVINMEQFQKMKQNWFEEIETIWKSLKEKEKELEFREEKAKLKEEEAKRKEQEIERMKRFLLQQSKELKRREIEVVGRELNVLLQQHQKPNNHNNHRRPKKRLSKKTLFASGYPYIGYPQNFCHNLTITSTSQDKLLQPSLQARALNQTWTPGTKIRPELHAGLFTNVSHSSSTSQDLHDKGRDDESNKESIKRTRKKERIGLFLKKIFKLSKSNINKVSTVLSSPVENDEKTAIQIEESVQNIKIVELYSDNYEVVESFELNSKHDVFSLNRTYHGQTKHSERQRINLLEHFRVKSSSESDEENEHDYEDEDNNDDNDDNNDDDDDDESNLLYDTSSNDNSNYRTTYQSIPMIDQSHYYYHQLRANENFIDINNNQNNDHPYFYSSLNNAPHSSINLATRISDSKKTLDDDLLKEFDRFEQEFQSMHCA